MTKNFHTIRKGCDVRNKGSMRMEPVLCRNVL